jgi:hypothetical protein
MGRLIKRRLEHLEDDLGDGGRRCWICGASLESSVSHFEGLDDLDLVRESARLDVLHKAPIQALERARKAGVITKEQMDYARELERELRKTDERVKAKHGVEKLRGIDSW